MKMQIPEDKLTAIKAALFEGRKIEAIKLYREAANCGLADAKNAVDKLESDLRTASPEKFSTKTSRQGASG
jgi:ribosomal protein L7/L12